MDVGDEGVSHILVALSRPAACQAASSSPSPTRDRRLNSAVCRTRPARRRGSSRGIRRWGSTFSAVVVSRYRARSRPIPHPKMTRSTRCGRARGRATPEPPRRSAADRNRRTLQSGDANDLPSAALRDDERAQRFRAHRRAGGRLRVGDLQLPTDPSRGRPNLERRWLRCWSSFHPSFTSSSRSAARLSATGTGAASAAAVPRPASFRRSWCPDERAHESAVDCPPRPSRHPVPIREECVRVLETIDARRLDVDRRRIRPLQQAAVLVFLQRARHAAHPQLHVSLHLGRHLAAHNHVGYREAAAGLQHAKRFARTHAACRPRG